MPLNKPTGPRLAAQAAAQRPRRRRSRSASRSSDFMDIYEDLQPAPEHPPPPPSLPIQAEPSFGRQDPCLSVVFENLVDNLGFHIQDISILFRDCMVASNPTTVFLDADFQETKRELIQYARPKRFYFKCHVGRNCFELIAMKPKKKGSKTRMARPVPSSPPPVSPPPAPRTPPSSTAPSLVPRPPSFPPPNQSNPSHKKFSYVELARRRGAPQHQPSSSSGRTVLAPRAPPLPPPPPPPPPPAQQVSASTRRIADRLTQSQSFTAAQKQERPDDEAAGRAWAAKRLREAAHKPAPWRAHPKIKSEAPSRQTTTSTASSSTHAPDPQSIDHRIKKIRTAFNSILDAL